jgi:hypothetical protein
LARSFKTNTISQTNYLNYIFPNFIPTGSPLNSIIKTIGAAFIGSGVFTAVIKSSEYTDIFTKIIGEIIWSKKYIEHRKDKKEIWSMVSRLMYNEKFPDISDDLESIIAKHYFPVDHNFYSTNYEFIINLSNCAVDDEYWHQTETTNVTIKAQNAEQEIPYRFSGNIDLPERDNGNDLTKYEITQLTVNGKDETFRIPPATKSGNLMTHSVELLLKNAEEYKISIQREKTVNKKTNPDKRFFASNIIKDFKLTVIMEKDCIVNLHKMGTIGEFIQVMEQTNNGVKITTWNYNGVILPHQGFMLLFKY